jgi:hypothetical protein
MRLLIISLLICSQSLLSSYYSPSEISNIIAVTATRTHSNVSIQYQLKIKALKADMYKSITNQRKLVSNLTNKYEQKISIMKQKHDLELQANTLKYKNKRNMYMILGGVIGSSLTIGSYLLADTIEFPLFKIQF